MRIKRAFGAALFERAAAIDAALLAVPNRVKSPRCRCHGRRNGGRIHPQRASTYFDYSRVPLLSGIQQRETYGTDSISDMYGAKVVLNDPSDMFTKERLAQTPLEAATWSKEASAPYPPAVLLAEAGLYAFGEWSGIGFYGVILGLAFVFLSLSCYYFLKTRWYLFPVLYLNFSYFSYRFVYVQDNTYLVMLVVIMAALFLARARREICHALMAVAIIIKLSPLYYVKNVLTMRRPTAVVFVAILLAGLVLPYFVWDNYLYIYRYGNDLKGDWASAAASLVFMVPFAIVLWYVEVRLGFDMEDRIGWGLVPFAMLLGLKMNSARHLLIVLLVPDKRGIRNVAAAIGLAFPFLFPSLVAFNSALLISTAVLCIGLVFYLDQIGWDVVRDDFRHPRRTAKIIFDRERYQLAAIGGSRQRPRKWGVESPRAYRNPAARNLRERRFWYDSKHKVTSCLSR